MANTFDPQGQATNLISSEKANWETGYAFITEKVAFMMRNLIRQCRKNYWGVFDEEKDPITGRKKIWRPLTEMVVEAVIKNIDLDTKDITFRAKKLEAIGITSVIRNAVRNTLDHMYFGEDLDEMERVVSIDGTCVWRTFEEYDHELKKKTVRKRNVDLLNFYIDPTAHSIREACREGGVLERIIIPIDELKAMKDWINTEEVKGSLMVNRNDADFNSGNTEMSSVPAVEVYRRVGKAPKSILTADFKDADKYEYQEIYCSNSNGAWKFHFAKKIKYPIDIDYEEAWYTRVPGRWYGKGIPEKLLMLQLWANIVLNIRVNRSYVSQLGIFKLKRGSGITPQVLGRLASNGAVMVNSLDDLEQMVVQDIPVSSYKDDDVIQNYAERLTSAFQAVTGETLPSGTTATVGALQSKAAMSQFSLIKKGIGSFIERWIKRQALPIIAKNLTQGEIIRLTGSSEELKEFDERIVNEMLYQKLEEMNKKGQFFDPMQVEQEKQRALKQLGKMGKERFVEVKDSIDFSLYDVEVNITNEKIDTGVLAQNLVEMLKVAPQFQEPLIKKVMDLFGLDSFEIKPAPMPIDNQTQLPSQLPNSALAGSQQQVITAANTLNG